MQSEEELIRRVQADLVDSYDEELELELDDRLVDAMGHASQAPSDDEKGRRLLYFRELFRLQGELVRLGARFVIAGTDVNYVLAGARADTTALREIPLG